MKYLAVMTVRMDFTCANRPTLADVGYLEELLHKQKGFPPSVKVVITNLIELGDD